MLSYLKLTYKKTSYASKNKYVFILNIYMHSHKRNNIFEAKIIQTTQILTIYL